MTLAEFQPYVERAIADVARTTARMRIIAGLEAERDSIRDAIRFLEETTVCPHCGGQHCVHIETIREQREPMEERLEQIELVELPKIQKMNIVPEDQVPELPLLSVPMDLITEAVARRIFHVPSEFPILRLRQLPLQADIFRAVSELSAKWKTAGGQSGQEPQRLVEHV